MPSRREFLRASGLAALGMAAARRGRGRAALPSGGNGSAPSGDLARSVTLFLCGDVMLGRGIDQILARPSKPRIFERWADSALDYVRLAEQANGPIPRSVGPEYVWGDALAELESRQPDLRIVNLETSVTTSSDWEAKSINYRMHPANVSALTAAGIDCCVLANNHVLDWGRAGFAETLATLRAAGLATAGAGASEVEAMAPAVLELGNRGRVLVWGLGTGSSGIPPSWGATADRPGVARLPDLSLATARRVAAAISQTRRPADLVVASIHWGGNWGYEIGAAERAFAHTLIDEGGVDIVHGHSSHHPKGIEVFRERPIFHGCGDFVNDYEGIGGHEEYRSHLVLGYVATIDPPRHALTALELLPFRVRRFRLERAASEEAGWLRATVDRESSALGARVEADADGRLWLKH